MSTNIRFGNSNKGQYVWEKWTYSNPKRYGDFQIGDTLNIRIGSNIEEFVVAHKGNPDSSLYDDSCNGVWIVSTGILLNQEGNPYGSDYKGSDDFSYSNGPLVSIFETMYSTLDEKIKSAVKLANIPVHDGTSTSLTTISTHMFAPSAYELGLSGYQYLPDIVDGAKLDYYDLSIKENEKRIRNYFDWYTTYHTRSGSNRNKGQSIAIKSKTGAPTLFPKSFESGVVGCMIMDESAIYEVTLEDLQGNVVSDKEDKYPFDGISGDYYYLDITRSKSGSLTPDKVLRGQIFTSDQGVRQIGSIPNVKSTYYTPGTSSQKILAGQYVNSDITISGNSNLLSKNIKRDISIFGVKGKIDPIVFDYNIRTEKELFYEEDLTDSNRPPIYLLSDGNFLTPYSKSLRKINKNLEVIWEVSTGDYSTYNDFIDNILEINGNIIYCTGSGQGTPSSGKYMITRMINGTNGETIWTLNWSGQVTNPIIDPITNNLYVTGNGSGSNYYVYRIDIESGTILNQAPTSDNNFPVMPSIIGDYYYVAYYYAQKVFKLNKTTLEIVSTLSFDHRINFLLVNESGVISIGYATNNSETNKKIYRYDNEGNLLAEITLSSAASSGVIDRYGRIYLQYYNSRNYWDILDSEFNKITTFALNYAQNTYHGHTSSNNLHLDPDSRFYNEELEDPNYIIIRINCSYTDDAGSSKYCRGYVRLLLEENLGNLYLDPHENITPTRYRVYKTSTIVEQTDTSGSFVPEMTSILNDVYPAQVYLLLADKFSNYYVSGQDGSSLNKIASDGTLIWSVDVGANGRNLRDPVFDENEEFLYFVDNNNNIYKVNCNDGTLEWSKTSSYSINKLKIYKNTIYAVGYGCLLAFNTSDGQQVWYFSTGYSQNIFAIDIYNDYIYYIDHSSRYLYKLNINGSNRTQVSTTSFAKVVRSLVIGSDGFIYIANDDSSIYKVTTDGIILWSKTVGDGFIKNMYHNDRYLHSNSTSYFCKLDTITGNIIWRKPKHTKNYSALGQFVIDPNTRELVCALNGALLKLSNNEKVTKIAYYEEFGEFSNKEVL